MKSETHRNEEYHSNDHNSESVLYDVTGIGSPLLDIIIEVEDEILFKIGLKKGHMHLIDEDKSKEILNILENYPMEIAPGGSSANTLAGISNFGGKCIFFGKVGNDSYGDLYIRESERVGVETMLSKLEKKTGHAITLITPDSERTFATHLGAALHFRQEDVIESYIKNSKILHIEGYLLELPEIREATIYAMSIAKANNVKVSIDLSDASLISRIPDVIDKVVNEYSNIVFVNEDEARAFTGKESMDALNMIYSMCDIAVVKLGAEGSLIKKDNDVYTIPAYRTNVVNTNGAGDMYAAGVLYGISNDLPIERAGKIGSYTSSLIVSQTGARLNEKIDMQKISDFIA